MLVFRIGKWALLAMVLRLRNEVAKRRDESQGLEVREDVIRITENHGTGHSRFLDHQGDAPGQLWPVNSEFIVRKSTLVYHESNVN